MRAVLDVNVLISGVLASRGSPSQLLRAHRDGQFELIVSPLLLAELERALAYPKLRKYIPAEKAQAFVSWLGDHGNLAEDPAEPPQISSADPDDDYLIALAIGQRAFLVSGDNHLLSLQKGPPILSPAEFLRQLFGAS